MSPSAISMALRRSPAAAGLESKKISPHALEFGPETDLSREAVFEHVNKKTLRLKSNAYLQYFPVELFHLSFALGPTMGSVH